MEIEEQLENEMLEVWRYFDREYDLDTLKGRIHQIVSETALRLADPTTRKEEAAWIIASLWRGQVPASWWSTPVGLLVGPLAEDQPITQMEAANILGVKQGTISTLLQRGSLARSDAERPESWDGPKTAQPVSRASVLARLARLQPRKDHA